MFLARRMALFAVIVLMSLFVPISARAESEPNDSIATADPISIGYNHAELDATLSSNDDVDFYSFSTAANQTYVMETFNVAGTPGGRATSLRLFNASGTELARDQSGTVGTGNANARIVFKFVTAGTYFLKAACADFYNWTGTYSLRVLPKYNQPGAGWDAANDFEPNDTVEIANEIGVGLSNAVTRQLFDHTSFVTDDGDEDFYRFAVQAGQTFVIETFNVVGTPGSRATSLRLFNASGTELARDQSGTAGTGNANARIVFTFASAGTYFLRVARADFYNWTGTYSLRVLPKYDQPGAQWDAANDFEPNDTIEIANAIGIGLSNAVTRQLFDHTSFVTDDGDEDFYRFAVQAGQTFVIETFNVVGTPGGRATSLRLFNASGTELARDQSGTAGTGNANARIVFTFTSAGTYFLRVARADFYNWTGTYSLRVLPKYDQPGAQWDAANDFEPNDVIPLANQINVGLANAQTHRIFPIDNLVTGDADQDYYRFQASAGQRYIIQTFNVQMAVNGVGTGIYLYNSTGTELANDSSGTKGKGNVNGEITFTFTNAGTYFVRVTERRFYEWTGTYSVRVCAVQCGRSVLLPMIIR